MLFKLDNGTHDVHGAGGIVYVYGMDREPLYHWNENRGDRGPLTLSEAAENLSRRRSVT